MATRKQAGIARDTGALLVEAAAKEFRQHGFDGTDTNKIARRAGFAPQTFYRWFKDKTAIFLAVYRNWIDEDFRAAGTLLGEDASDKRLIDSAISFHRAYRIFRRSLRRLALEDPAVRKARAASRLDQIARLKGWMGPRPPGDEAIAVLLLIHERLCDAIAEGEFADMGLTDRGARAELERLYRMLRPTGGRAVIRPAP